MNFFSNKKVYGGKWSVKSVSKFTEEEIALVDKAIVVESDFGESCCFFMKNGTTIYTPMSNDSKSSVGDSLNLRDIEIVVLEKTGESDIARIRG